MIQRAYASSVIAGWPNSGHEYWRVSEPGTSSSKLIYLKSTLLRCVLSLAVIWVSDVDSTRRMSAEAWLRASADLTILPRALAIACRHSANAAFLIVAPRITCPDLLFLVHSLLHVVVLPLQFTEQPCLPQHSAPA